MAWGSRSLAVFNGIGKMLAFGPRRARPQAKAGRNSAI